MAGILQPTRRQILIGMSGMTLAGMGGSVRAEGRTLYVNSWGGSWSEAQKAAFYDPFTAETGINIETVSPVSIAKLKAQVQSGVYEWDVTAINEPEWSRANTEGLAEPLDWKILDKAALPEGAVFANGIALCTLSTNLCYRSDRFPNGGPQSWADFWDVTKFPGARGMYDSAPRSIAFALLADGVPHDELYPLDIERGLKKLSEIKPHVKVWWKQGNQSQQLMRDGEVDMMPMWNARATELKEQGVPVEIVWNGGIAYRTIWGVARNTPNRDIAWQFIQFTTRPEAQAEFSRRLFYGPINQDALALLPDELARQMPTHPDNMAQMPRPDPEWEAANLEMMQEQFLQWLAQ